jgi:hypothetical protein
MQYKQVLKKLVRKMAFTNPGIEAKNVSVKVAEAIAPNSTDENVVTGVATHMRSRLLRKISAFKEMKQSIVTEYKDKTRSRRYCHMSTSRNFARS